MRTQWPEHARLPIPSELAGHQTCTGQKDSSSNGSKKREPEEQAGSLSAHRAPQTKRSRGMHAPVLCISTYILVAKVYDYSLNCEDIAFVLPYNNLPGGEPLATAKWRRPQLLSFSFFYYYFFCLAGLLFSFGPSFVLVPRDKRHSRIIPLPTFGKKEISPAKAREKTRNFRPPSGLPELAALYSARYELMRSKSRGKRGQQRKKGEEGPPGIAGVVCVIRRQTLFVFAVCIALNSDVATLHVTYFWFFF